MKDADIFPFWEGDMIKVNKTLYYVHDVHNFNHDTKIIVYLMKVGTTIATRVEFEVSDLKRQDFVDAMKPTEEEKRLALLLHDEYDDNYFLSTSSDDSFDALRYSMARPKRRRPS